MLQKARMESRMKWNERKKKHQQNLEQVHVPNRAIDRNFYGFSMRFIYKLLVVQAIFLTHTHETGSYLSWNKICAVSFFVCCVCVCRWWANSRKSAVLSRILRHSCTHKQQQRPREIPYLYLSFEWHFIKPVLRFGFLFWATAVMSVAVNVDRHVSRWW